MKILEAQIAFSDIKCASQRAQLDKISVGGGGESTTQQRRPYFIKLENKILGTRRLKKRGMAARE